MLPLGVGFFMHETLSLQLDFGFLPSCDCLSFKVSRDPWGS